MSSAARVANVMLSGGKAALAPFPRLRRVLYKPWRQVRKVRDYRTRVLAARTQRDSAERVRTIERYVRAREAERSTVDAPIVYFNASAHTGNVTFAAYAWLVTSWGLRLGGERIVNYICRGGLRPCVIGSIDRFRHSGPPCAACRAASERIFDGRVTEALEVAPGGGLKLLGELCGLSLAELERFEHGGLELGRMALPSVRWALRRSTLADDEPTRGLYARYLASAADLAEAAGAYLERVQPKAVVMFNGTFYPEAVFGQVARSRGIRTITFEVGFRRNSVFFSHGTATEYAVEIPEEYELGGEEARQFDDYLRRRFRGECYMGGTNYWNDITGLSGELVERMRASRQVVPIFTNVGFDTSQVTANTIFESMFEWVAETLEAGRRFEDTLFVVRAHPAEARPSKRSAEPVGEVLAARGLLGRANVALIPPTQPISSYELIRRSAFCLVYNSTIGLEVVILGKPVLVAGLPKYMGQGVGRMPTTREAYFALLEEWLKRRQEEASEEEQRLAKRYFHHLVFRNSLDFSGYVHEPFTGYGYALRPFAPEALRPERSREVGIIRKGIVEGSGFCYA